ncbi:hypothetical protein NL676_007567 [Syzygium grande]|nr:hypothetical protein NL676_007567 [Syzygium grande]
MKTLAPSFRSYSKPFQSSFFSSSPPLRTRDHVSFRTRTQVSFRGACSSKRLGCRDGGEMVANSSPDGEDVKKRKKRKLAVFVSGRGSNFRAIHEACVAGTISGEVAAVVTEKSGCAGAVFARDMDIPVILFPKTKQDPDALSASDLIVALRRYEVDFILLAGYLKLIPIELIKSFPKSIINTHPSLLLAFGGKGYYGMKVHDSVIASGARYSGPTIHFIDEHYDRGRILAQRAVPVLANDTAEELATRVLQVEHRLYVETVAALCEERIVWREDGIPLIRSIENPELYS